MAIFWTITGAIIAKRNGVGDNGLIDGQYFQSAFAQSTLVTLLLLSASQMVGFSYGFAVTLDANQFN